MPAFALALGRTLGELVAFEKPRLLLTVDRSGEHHACRRHTVREEAFDQWLQLINGGQGDFDEEGFAAGDVMTLLHSLKRREKLEEGSIVLVVAGQSDEGDDRVAERPFVEDCSIAEDDALALQLVDALGYGGWGQTYATSQLRKRKPGIGGKLPHNVVIN